MGRHGILIPNTAWIRLSTLLRRARSNGKVKEGATRLSLLLLAVLMHSLLARVAHPQGYTHRLAKHLNVGSNTTQHFRAIATTIVGMKSIFPRLNRLSVLRNDPDLWLLIMHRSSEERSFHAS